jgi:protein transport protein SEC13
VLTLVFDANRSSGVLADRTVKVYNVSDSSYAHAGTLTGFDGPVWQVSWAHPRFGIILASCSFDGSVLVHREVSPQEWVILYAARQIHDSSVNGVAFAPQDFGLMLAAASSDGRVSVLTHQPDQTWAIQYLADCTLGVNGVSWAPAGAYHSLPAPSSSNAIEGEMASSSMYIDPNVPRIVTAGCDNQIRFWLRRQSDGMWELDPSPIDTSKYSHSDWVRDVSWAPSLIPNENIVASCSEDRTVLIWRQVGGAGKAWSPSLLHTFAAPVWRVSWSVTGHLLAVSSGDNEVSMWKAGLDGKYTRLDLADEKAS